VVAAEAAVLEEMTIKEQEDLVELVDLAFMDHL
jgi:hypothetical protein